MSDIYGHMYGMPFARYDPTSSSWRTSPDTSLLDLPMSSPVLPKSGSMRNGQLSERPTLEPAIDANDCSSLPTLPTPAVNDMGAGKTPETWQQWTATMRTKHGNGNGHGKSLEQEAISLLPTPRAQNGEERNQNIWARPLDQP